jgi:hypothetical protein
MIGNGRNRQGSETHWDVDTSGDPWVWTEVGPAPPPDLSGYKWASGSTKRWGTNAKDKDEGLINSGGSFGITDMFSTVFDDDEGDDEAQGATFDSGGGVFYDTGSEWELAGIMLLTAEFKDQPGSTAIYGNRTAMADMQYYAVQIADTAQIDDLDEDGIPDGWEYAQTGSSTGVLASIDQDGDGFTGEEEWLADTVPNDSNSFLRITGYTNSTELVFTSSTNRKYQIRYRADLTDTNESWQTELGWFAGSHDQTVTNVSNATTSRFFEVRATLP